MIRDFWGIKRSRLIGEINELEENIDPDTWAAIDSVRKMGNIGAHMGKDVNVIIDVVHIEAGQLIWLIETLLTEWYIVRHVRKERMAGLAKLSEEKKHKTEPQD